MKTPEEIKKSLECCSPEDGLDPFCDGCQYKKEKWCSDQRNADTLAYIQQLEANFSQVSKALCGKETAALEEVLLAVSQVKRGYKPIEVVCNIDINREKLLRELMDETDIDGKTLSEWLELLKGYKQLERELEAVKQDGCDFCKTFDFSSARTEVTKRAAHISLALGNTNFYGDGRFEYCPMCGKLLPEPPKEDNA